MAILTISREIGTEGRLIGKAIADEMGYTFYDKEKVLQELREDGARWGKLGEELDEHSPSLWEKYDWQYWGFIALAKSHILECAMEGHAVIMGRGGNFLLDGIAHATRVRIIAPMEKRLSAVTDKGNEDFISSDVTAAKKLLEKADKESEELMKSVFSKHWNDPRAYDLTINMINIDNREIKEALKAILKESEKQKDAASEKLLKLRFIAAKIHAIVATNPALLVPTLEAYPSEKGGIVLKGVVHSAKEHKIIEDEAKKIAGDIPVDCELHYR